MQNVKENHNNGDDVISRTAWHPAFVEALKVELDEYRDVLEFHDEYQLTAEPLRIDCVIIKKAEGTVIRKNIAAIFRRVNLLEYKSPDESLSIDGFYKIHSYATLYASLGRVPITDITVSFVLSRYPRNLIRHLRSVCGHTVEKTHPGIYTVNGAVCPMQFIDSRKLSGDENLWLKSLRKLSAPVAVEIFNEIASREVGNRMRAYLDVMVRNNAFAVQEVLKMGRAKTPNLRVVLEEAGLIAEWKAEAEAEWEAKTLEMARFFIEQGFPFETVVSGTKLAPEKVRELAGGTDR